MKQQKEFRKLINIMKHDSNEDNEAIGKLIMKILTDKTPDEESNIKLIIDPIYHRYMRINCNTGNRLSSYIESIKHVLIDMIYNHHIIYFMNIATKFDLIKYNTMIYFIKKLLNSDFMDINIRSSIPNIRNLIQKLIAKCASHDCKENTIYQHINYFIELENDTDKYIRRITHPFLQQVNRSNILEYGYQHLYDNYMNYIHKYISNSGQYNKFITDILRDNIYDKTILLHPIINVLLDNETKLKHFNLIIKSYVDITSSNPISLFLMMYSHFTQLFLNKQINLKELLKAKTELILQGNKIGMNTKPIREIMTVDVRRK
mgnify:CR=1 FL=1|jgi:hypothetical protein